MCLEKSCRKRLVRGEQRCADHHAAHQLRQAHLAAHCSRYASGQPCLGLKLTPGDLCDQHQREVDANEADARRARDAMQAFIDARTAEHQAYEAFKAANAAWWPAFREDLKDVWDMRQ